MKLVSAKEMLTKAKEGHYAVGHFNLNNMESIRAFLLAAQETRSPIILGVSGGTAKYIGGYRTIADTVQGFMDFLQITVPVALHVDHGTYEEALDAIENGFSSVMFDGSKYSIAENIEKTKEVVSRAHAKGISVEAEVGAIGGEEDGVIAMGECADPAECERIASLGIGFLGAARRRWCPTAAPVSPPIWSARRLPWASARSMSIPSARSPLRRPPSSISPRVRIS